MSESIQETKTIIDGAKYCFVNTSAGTGEIYNSDGQLIRRYAPSKTIFNLLNGPFRFPEFIVTDVNGQELLKIQRESRFPLPKYVMTINGVITGMIYRRSIFSTKFTVELKSGKTWEFHIPMYSVNFKDESKDGSMVDVRLASELVWYVLINTGMDSLQLVSALAFVHSERVRTQ